MSTDNPYLKEEDSRLTITEEGYRKLEEMVTDVQGQVYAFKPRGVSPIKVGAAMARLSRRAGDMRVAILDEFMEEEAQREDLLIKRVVSQYGDDSVQQLVNVQFVVEEASNLLTKKLEWGRFGAYLEQSTRYIYFDQKDAGGKFLYFTPELPEAVEKTYNQVMEELFTRYSSMVRSLVQYLREKNPEPLDKKERQAWINSTRATACDAVRSVLPAATKSTVGANMSMQAIESLIWHLQSDPLKEARDTGEKILREVRKVAPAFLERTDMPDRGNVVVQYRWDKKAEILKLAKKYLAFKVPEEGVQVKLISHWPSDEMDLIPEMIFESADQMSLSEIQKQVAIWSVEQKLEVFQAYMGQRRNRRHRPGRALEKAHFEWEIVGDYGTFRDLQRHRVVDSLEWQALTPFWGYEVPSLVSEAGLEGEFRYCFEISQKLHEFLINSGHEAEAQYAVLLGHRVLYRLILNLRAAFHLLELRTGPTGHPGYRKICGQMHEQLAAVYPLHGMAMRFVNREDVHELYRQDAEKRTQDKLEKLSELK